VVAVRSHELDEYLSEWELIDDEDEDLDE